ncbi:MAG TPA: hypothetical protein VK536_08745 [Candidatus Limnocylindrales bacterium]|nr:hypothetical protein [Candidatus Limnocylindrales bacterium]
MDKVNGYAGAQLILGFLSIIIGPPALTFASIFWYQAAQSTLWTYARYVCIVGSLGATVFGASLARDGARLWKSVSGKHALNRRR